MSDLSILETSIIEPLDPAFVKKTLSQPPFYQIQGLINTRSIPLPEPTPGTKQRGLILRGAETNHITTLGKNQLSQQLGVTTIFDLRSDKERAKFGPDPLDIPGVEIVCVPAMSASQTDDLKATFGRFGGRGDEGFVDFYREVLENGVGAYKRIFEFLRDEFAEGKGCLIHCTGGKDRTGVAAMLILDLIGVSDEEIIRDYALTRVGGEPMREMMVKRFAPLLQDPEVGEASVNALSCRPSVMRATLDMLREEFGGAAGYLKDRLGFSAEDVVKIMENLTSKEKFLVDLFESRSRVPEEVPAPALEAKTKRLCNAEVPGAHGPPRHINLKNWVHEREIFSKPHLARASMEDLSILETSILQPLDPEHVERTLSSPPFYQIQGVFNVRSIPLPPIPPSVTRGLVLRSGETNRITSLGKILLAQQLGITKIFDLRSDKERARFASDSALDIPGVEIVCVPARTAEPKDDLKTIFGRFGANGGDEGFVDAYRAALEQGKKAHRRIFEFLRDELPSGNGCLIHCTGGKDRTGVAAMLILALAGVSDEEIMRDYALTRVGGEPMREITLARFAELLQDPEIAKSSANALGCRSSAMRATLGMLRREYGGEAGYLEHHLEFSSDDVAKIVGNLTCKSM